MLKEMPKDSLVVLHPCLIGEFNEGTKETNFKKERISCKESLLVHTDSSVRLLSTVADWCQTRCNWRSRSN